MFEDDANAVVSGFLNTFLCEFSAQNCVSMHRQVFGMVTFPISDEMRNEFRFT